MIIAISNHAITHSWSQYNLNITEWNKELRSSQQLEYIDTHV